MLSADAHPPTALVPVGRNHDRSGRTGVALVGLGLAEEALCRGPYRMIRYPGYLGNLMIWSGATMASGNTIALITVALAMLAAYMVRISAEEAAAVGRSVGAVSGATRQTWRLIPFVY